MRNAKYVCEPTYPEPRLSPIALFGSLSSSEDDQWTANFLHYLWNNLLTDDAIIARLDKHWTEKRLEYFMQGHRHSSMLTMAGTLCKAGVAKEKTESYLTPKYSNMPYGEIQGVIDFAYDHNAFGCDRRQYRR